MRYFVTTFLLVALVLISISFADVNLTGGKITTTFTEPVLNSDGSTLIDLFGTIIYYRIDQGEWIEVGTVLASSLTGGGFQTFEFAIDIPEESEVNILASAICRDISGNFSQRAVSSVIRIDKLAPGSPIF